MEFKINIEEQTILHIQVKGFSDLISQLCHDPLVAIKTP